MSFIDNLDKIITRHNDLSDKLSSGTRGDEFIKMSREFSELSPIVEKIIGYQTTAKEIVGLKEIINDPTSDPDMKEMASDELTSLEAKLPSLEHAVRISLLPKDAADEKNAIIEVRAGTGGEEAALFAASLFGMYQRYAEAHKWTFEILSLSETGIGGYKEASAIISGNNVFARLKFESGVHRVQRVPDTESSGRIHTSAATVAVLPEAEEVDVHIEDKDIRIDTYRASGAGGQHVNKTSSAVRLVHEPTGLVASSQQERSQLQNRESALKRLKAMIIAQDEEERANALDQIAGKQAQVGWGSQIRSYVLQPYQMVKDLRTNVETGNVTAVLDGELDQFMEGYLRWRRSDKEATNSAQ